MVVLAGLALIVVGPEKLPSLARNLGKFLNDLKRTTNTIGSEFKTAIDEDQFMNDSESKETNELEANKKEDA